MASHPDDRPLDLGDMPSEEDVETADPADDLDADPDADPDVKLNYTERHPEHFRNPPGHVRELRENE